MAVDRRAPVAASARAGGAGARELDELTLRRAQRGEPAAFRALVETYQQRVWELCWRMLAPAGLGHRAEDLSQETFVRVFRALARFEASGPARLSTWILTIATRRALSELGRVRPRVVGEEAALAALEAASFDGGVGVAASAGRGAASEASARRELGDRLAAAIGALPDGARAVLLLRDLYELDYDEIARALELEVGTGKSRLSRARAAVRARLQGDGR
jgi:RNA polymerase sigma-70 factor (ECF subfamily)